MTIEVVSVFEQRLALPSTNMEKINQYHPGNLLFLARCRAIAVVALILLAVIGADATSWAQSSASGAAPATPKSTVPLTSGLIGYWGAEGNARDSVGTNHALLCNGAGFADGIAGKAFNFDGQGGYIYIPGSASLNPGNEVTVEMWIKPDPQNAMQTYQGLIASDYYVLEFGNGFGRPQMGIHFALSSDNSLTVPWPQTADANNGGFPVSPGVWHHVAGTYDGTRLQLYIDGEAAGRPLYHSGSISPMRPGDGITIGGEERKSNGPDPSGNRFFQGLIDEVAIYHRALSADEIKSTYAARASLFPAKPILPAAIRSTNTMQFQQPQSVAAETIIQEPTLTISLRPPNLIIAWPAPANGFLLEGGDTFNPATWTVVDTVPVTNGSLVTATLPLRASPKYFRLHHP